MNYEHDYVGEPLDTVPEFPAWRQAGFKIGFWPFSWSLGKERIHRDWWVWALDFGPFSIEINLGKAWFRSASAQGDAQGDG